MVINKAGAITGKEEWGITDGLFIDGREMRVGPPPDYEKIRKKIARKAIKK
jgi:hypothetical protein